MNVTTTDATPVAAPIRLMADSVISQSLSSMVLASVNAPRCQQPNQDLDRSTRRQYLTFAPPADIQVLLGRVGVRGRQLLLEQTWPGPQILERPIAIHRSVGDSQSVGGWRLK